MSGRDASGKPDRSGSEAGGSSSPTGDSLETPWTRARKMRSQLQEQRLNTLPGGRKGINSGRFWRWKRDGRIHDFLVEARTNEKPGVKTATINKQEFLDLKRQALEQPGGMKAAMQVTMDDLDLIVIELAVFTEMYTHLLTLAERDADGAK